MAPSELFGKNLIPEDLTQWIATEQAVSRRMLEVFGELLRDEPGKEPLNEESRGVLKRMSQLQAERSREEIEIVKKALQTWETNDVDAALRVLHPNLAPA